MRPLIIPADLKGKELFDFVVKNEALIFHAKKSEKKEADGAYVPMILQPDAPTGLYTTKAAAKAPMISDNASVLKVDVVINTTNLFDSHWDVHIPGLWKKTLGDNKKNGFYLLENHGRDFDDVIGEGLKGMTQKISWQELGYDFPGITEALIFSGQIEKERNEFMFGQYQKGYVKQHSVGMRYVSMVTCINDDSYLVQKENWDKYIKMVVNADEAEEKGIFWAILEAKCIEGSAVLFGSNQITPTRNVEEVSTTDEGSDKSTPDQPPTWDISKAIQETKFF